jgi:Zn-dependent M28 family amino/carboxypeptidase
MKNNIQFLLVIIIATFIASCGGGSETPVNDTPKTTTQPVDLGIPKDLPKFNPDTAYLITETQVNFGPRIPNSPAHVKCGDYIISQLKKQGAEVIVQATTVTAYTGESLKIRNIIGRIQPELTKRIMLCAHWDTRPFSDRDANKPKEKFDGAVDGAASIGILVEVARILKSKPANVGVDIVFFDAEDYGDPNQGNTYCLGSQYFSANPPFQNKTPQFGILLDMAAAPGATFFREGYSMQYAPQIVGRVWAIGKELGFGPYFREENSGAITDDHFFVNSILGLPTIDIIHHDPASGTGFGEYWHTQQDNMQQVDKNTMTAVGQTLLGVIYSEK